MTSTKDKKPADKQANWLLFFYTVPAKPTGSRTKIWRRLTKIGAVKLKSAVYLLPDTEEHTETLTWLVAEISSLGGEGAFAKSRTIEPFSEIELIDLFNRQCDQRFSHLSEKLDRLERKISGYTGKIGPKRLADQLNKLEREFSNLKKTDFFASKVGIELEKRIKQVKDAIDHLTVADKKQIPAADSRQSIPLLKKDNYQRKIWVTRKNPFVDRMACGWLIKSFIDSEAGFAFIDDNYPLPVTAHQITYDITRGDFTHVNDLCTFEVMLIAFGLQNPELTRMARIVHAIDLHDESRSYPEAEGLERILTGIQKTATDSNRALAQGMDVFAALYASFT